MPMLLYITRRNINLVQFQVSTHVLYVFIESNDSFFDKLRTTEERSDSVVIVIVLLCVAGVSVGIVIWIVRKR